MVKGIIVNREWIKMYSVDISCNKRNRFIMRSSNYKPFYETQDKGSRNQ